MRSLKGEDQLENKRKRNTASCLPGAVWRQFLSVSCLSLSVYTPPDGWVSGRRDGLQEELINSLYARWAFGIKGYVIGQLIKLMFGWMGG